MLPTPGRIRSRRIVATFVAAGLCAAGAVLTVLLTRSPLLLAAGLAVTAVVSGLVFWWLTGKWRRRVALLRKPFPSDWSRLLDQRVAFYHRLEEPDRQRFHQMAAVFLDEVTITGVRCFVDDETRLLVAASAVIPVFGFEGWEYGMLREVLVYPERFNASFDPSHDPSVLGLVGNTGGAFNGIMVLSRPDLMRGFEQHGDRHNVGIHEFAHLVDKADGAIDGVGGALGPDIAAQWLEAVHAELISEYGRSRGKRHQSDIPAYGYTSREEFFAVASEYFFESPERLRENHPDLYEMMQKAYRQDTVSRFKSLTRKVFKPLRRSVGRNAPCHCGSGKKYKKCCLRKDEKRIARRFARRKTGS